MRLRFAPSPTGYLHVGNARTALFNWLLAHGSHGTLILRIEDTDAERSTPDFERDLLADLRWMGLNWQEGVEVGGPHGPYRQSERREIYAAHTEDLLSRNHAYRCFCSPAQLEADRQAALAQGRPPLYVGRCRSLSPDVVRRRLESGERAVVRFRVPEAREIAFTDIVRGEVRFATDVIGDPVLVRSDGFPAYNFTAVIDDALMQVSHVVRGEDHISNTPRQLLLYEAFGWHPPVFAHVSLVLGPDHTRLSKRHGATSVAEFRERGYLPEALVNYLALIGWSPGDGRELLPIEELARRFRLEDVGQSAGVFDVDKLAWANRHYLKEAAPDRLARLTVPYFQREGWLDAPGEDVLGFLSEVVPAAAGAVDRLDQVTARLGFLVDYSPQRTLAQPGIRAEVEAARAVIDALADELSRSAPLTDRQAFRAAVARLREQTGQKGRALLHPIRIVLTGELEGLELDVAVPAIERGAALASSGFRRRIHGAAERARAFRAALDEP